jgi:UDP-N-acetylglucosamine--dolichyl-phosphate N-acetylglucosaminephosphotransferase
MSTSSTASALSSTESLSLLSLTLACVGIISNTFRGDGEPLIASLAFSGIAFAASYSMIRWLGPTFMKAGLKGKDMSKVNKKEIPETMGAVCAVVYLLMIIVFIPFPFYKDIVAATSGGGKRDVVLEIENIQTGRFLHRFPHSKVWAFLDLYRVLLLYVVMAIVLLIFLTSNVWTNVLLIGVQVFPKWNLLLQLLRQSSISSSIWPLFAR